MGGLRFLTSGESHGRGLLVIVEGLVSGLKISEEYIANDLLRRQGGYGRGGRMQIERDRAEIITGVRHGLTIGSPIGLIIWNRDWQNWQEKMAVGSVETYIEKITSPRPGHADLAGMLKYQVDDIRLILERASARETTARVAAGSVARRFLEEFGIRIYSHTVAVGGIHTPESQMIDLERIENSPLRCSDPSAEKEMIEAIDKARAEGDTLGGIFEVVAYGVPVGLGSHVHWDRRLDGKIAQAIMSIHGVKGLEIGSGFNLSGIRGSQAHDIIEKAGPEKTGRIWQRPTNRAGGIEGGITNGEDIILRAAVKPIATLGNSLPSIDMNSGAVTRAHYERSDICVVPAAGVIGEAMLALTLANAALEKFGGDSLKEVLQNFRSYSVSTQAGETHE